MKYKNEEKRAIGLILVPVIVVGALSTVSFAQQRQPEPRFRWDVSVEGEFNDAMIGEDDWSNASPSVATTSVATSSNGRILHLDSEHGAISDDLVMTPFLAGVNVNWMQTKIDERLIYHSDQPNFRPETGFEVLDDTKLVTQVKVTIPRATAVGNGDEVTWVVGRVPGLDLPEENTGDMVLNNVFIGTATLSYDAEGTISIKTEFSDGMHSFGTVYITYQYEAYWVPVTTRKPIAIQMGDWLQSETIYVIPVHEPEETSTEEESTTPEETTTEEEPMEPTTPEETTTEEEPTEPTTPEETTTVEETATSSYRSPKSTDNSAKVKLIQIKPIESEIVSSEDLMDETEGEVIEVVETVVAQPASKAEKKDNEKKQEADRSEENAIPSTEAVIRVEAVEGSDDYIEAGSNITYQIEIKNESNEPIEHLRLRDYLPDHTSYVSSDGLGKYGVIGGKQHITWNVERIEPGETKYCTLTVKVFACTPENYPVTNRVYYQADDKASVNDPRDPEFEEVTSSLNVG